MLFNTLTYLLFLPIVFALYWSMRSRNGQNAVVLAASMVFYGWWDIRFLVLMLTTCLVNYGLLIALHRPELRSSMRRVALTTGLVVDFGILGLFKYYNFFADNLQMLFSHFGLHTSALTLSLILPVGISFYTFQLASYLIDCYRQKPTPNERPTIMEFLCFVCFFPQLVAGPIERAESMLSQFRQRRTFSFDQGRDGMRLILWGLMKKMLLADNCAATADLVFHDYATASMPSLWLGALAFTLQIYGDFSGYSDMAIGSARLMGIRLSRNFDSPFFAATIPEFWKRWHITLMTWFKDYVYIPLGGSRCSSLRHYLNILAVFALSGMWHGANWTYLLWGLYNALWYRIPHRYLTFPIFLVGLVIFRSTDVPMAMHYIAGMFSPQRWGPIGYSRMCLAYIALFMLAEWLMRRREHPFQFAQHGFFASQLVRFCIYLACFGLTLMLGGEQLSFIYFQF